MKPTSATSVRWVQPVHVDRAAEPITLADDRTSVTAHDLGVTVVRGERTVLVPWANVKQVDL